MSINLDGRGWSCWRNKAHAGIKPTRLVAALLDITPASAARLVGDSVFIPDDFIGTVRSKLAGNAGVADVDLRLPKEFKPIGDKPSARYFRRYLRGRGFTNKRIDLMTRRYGIYYCTRGRFKGRIVFTVVRDKKLQTWTARSIYAAAEQRYMTLSVNDEGTPARSSINDNILWYDWLKRGGETLVLCEGPFDALKVSVLGRKYGFKATCCFTAAPSEQQIELLYDVAPGFNRRLLLLDHGTLATSIRVSTALAAMKIQTILLPRHIKDPGDLSPLSFSKLFRLQG